MALLILIPKGEVPVIVQLRTVGRVHWSYNYDADGHCFAEKGTDHDWHRYALGTPEELHGDTHAWVFQLINAGDRDESYEVFVQWLQGSDLLREWHEKGTVKSTGDSRVGFEEDEASFLSEVSAI